MGCDPAVLDEPGVTVRADADRAQSQVTAGYVVGEHFIITCDPAAESMLAKAAADMTPSMQGWTQVAENAAGELLGGGHQYVLPNGLVPAAPLASGFTLRSLDNTDADDLAKIQRLVDASSQSDLDYAELAMEELDDVIVAAVDASGEIVSYASSMPFDMAPGFGDIAIITRPEHRAIGLGRATVAALCERIRAIGDEPLYRCESHNFGSIAVCSALGFTPAAEVRAYRFS